eukprot:6872691-Alexandrium_andersonii.AAC.1
MPARLAESLFASALRFRRRHQSLAHLSAASPSPLVAQSFSRAAARLSCRALAFPAAQLSISPAA